MAVWIWQEMFMNGVLIGLMLITIKRARRKILVVLSTVPTACSGAAAGSAMRPSAGLLVESPTTPPAATIVWVFVF